MSNIPDWEQYIVKQRSPIGCIPTGFEFLLRYAKIEGINYETFQEDFDFGQNNNFNFVADQVTKKYPSIRFDIFKFERGNGIEKLTFIEQCIHEQRAVLISLYLLPLNTNGYHIMPVVESSEKYLTLINGVPFPGFFDLFKIDKELLVKLHNNYNGGDDVACLHLDN